MVLDVSQVLGDHFHLASFLLVIISMHIKKSAEGWSGRLQILHTFVFATRYWDFESSFVSIYLGVTKITWVILSVYIIYLIFIHFKDTYEKRFDGFWIEMIIVFAFALAFIIVNDASEVEKVSWMFSRFAESVAILPQLYFVYNKRKKDLIVTYYVVLLIYYRVFYVCHWVTEYFKKEKFDPYVIYPGGVQLFFYCIYFLIPRGKRLPRDHPAAPPQLQSRPTYLTQGSLLETPLLKRSATATSSIYLLGEDSTYSTLNRSVASFEAGSVSDEGRF